MHLGATCRPTQQRCPPSERSPRALITSRDPFPTCAAWGSMVCPHHQHLHLYQSSAEVRGRREGHLSLLSSGGNAAASAIRRGLSPALSPSSRGLMSSTRVWRRRQSCPMAAARSPLAADHSGADCHRHPGCPSGSVDRSRPCCFDPRGEVDPQLVPQSVLWAPLALTLAAHPVRHVLDTRHTLRERRDTGAAHQLK